MKGKIRSLECVSFVFRKGAICPACPKATTLCESMNYDKLMSYEKNFNRMAEPSLFPLMPYSDCAARKQQAAVSVIP